MEKKRNLWVIPTDKPSRLHYYNHIDLLGLSKEYLKWKQGRNIYITSEEEIKEGDWVIFNELEIVKCNYSKNGEFLFSEALTSSSNHHFSYFKKIILTTDQDLIKDGVQVINDEFLEWFVKNPSCESVDVRKTCCGQCDERLCDVYDTNIGWTKENTFYEIAIPKEEHTTILTANAPLRPPVNLLCGAATSGIEPVRISFNKNIEEQSASVESRLQSAIALLKQTTEYEVLDSFKEKVKQLEIE